MSKRLEQYFYLVLGSTLLTLGIWLFVTPNQINFGGMIGLAQLIDYFIHKFLVLPKSLNTLGMINLLMNIPLFIFGYKIMNKEWLESQLAIPEKQRDYNWYNQTALKR